MAQQAITIARPCSTLPCVKLRVNNGEETRSPRIRRQLLSCISNCVLALAVGSQYSLVSGSVTVARPVIVVSSTNGSDTTGDGSIASPFATLQRCIDKLKASTVSGECRLRGGVYNESTVQVEGLVGTASTPTVIGAFAVESEAPVIFDGTEPLPSTLKWNQVPGSPSIYSTVLPPNIAPFGITQLFIDNQMMTPARWPNAFWHDKSVFDWSRWGRFDPSKPWSPGSSTKANASLRFYDSCGPSGLGVSGFNATGAVIVGNIAHDDTFTGRVIEHAPGSCSFEAVFPLVDKWGNTKEGNSIYFLEGLLAFVDAPTEFAYDEASRTLIIATDDGISPDNHSIRFKSKDYALNITSAKHLTVANLTFFGSTVYAVGKIPGFRLDSLNFSFPSFSRRMIGDLHAPDGTVLRAEANSVSYDTRAQFQLDPQDSSFTITNCSWYGADGPVFSYYGTALTFTNNLIESNDWSAADDDGHQGMGSAVLKSYCGSHDLIQRNTARGNGPSVVFAPGNSSTVALNFCTAEADCDNDGACFQIRSSAASNTRVEQNWVWQSVKGFRLDSGSNTAFCPEEVNNTITHNVAFLSQGFELKNDFNYYYNNLAIWGPRNGSVRDGSSVASAVFRIDVDRFPSENKHSTLGGNVATSVTTDYRGIVPLNAPNIFDDEVWRQFRDPWNRDFRPVAESAVTKFGAGPYEWATTKPDTGVVWIPGRVCWHASMPSPPHESTTADPKLDLIFLHGSASTVYAVWFGPSNDAMAKIGILNGTNVKSVPPQFGGQTGLVPGSQWWWRADALDSSGQTVAEGHLWKFSVRKQQPPVPSPPLPPSPVPPPPPPSPPAPSPTRCTACERLNCPGLAGGKALCEKCVEKHDDLFIQAGCFHHGNRHAFLKNFCGISIFPHM